MMYFAATAALAYLSGTFLASALLVRFVPRCYTARQIRKNLVLFMVMPLLLVVDMLTSIDLLRRISHALLCRGFEVLSGRQLLKTDRYSYFAYSRQRARRNRRRTDRSPQLRANGTRQRGLRA